MEKPRAPLVSLAVVALSGLMLCLPGPFELTRAGLAQGELWRLITGHLTHFSFYHFAVDAGTLLVLGWLYERRIGSGRWALLLGVGALIIGATFLGVETSLGSYRGLSGLDCAAFAAAIVAEYRRSKPLALLLGIVFAAKVVYEQASGAFLFPTANLGDMGAPVLSAHFAGALSGFVTALFAGSPPPPHSTGNAAGSRKNLRRGSNPCRLGVQSTQ